jgi:hypothetical protein
MLQMVVILIHRTLSVSNYSLYLKYKTDAYVSQCGLKQYMFVNIMKFVMFDDIKTQCFSHIIVLKFVYTRGNVHAKTSFCGSGDEASPAMLPT